MIYDVCVCVIFKLMQLCKYTETLIQATYDLHRVEERESGCSVTIIGAACCTCCFRLALLQFVVGDATVCFGLQFGMVGLLVST